MAEKRILEVIKIDEISAVDKPAQPGALNAIMKRQDPDKPRIIGKNVKMTTAEDGHQHIIDLVGWEGEHLYGGMTSWVQADGDQEAHSHPWSYDSKGGLVIGEALGHKHDIADLKKSSESNGDKSMAIKKSLLTSAASVATLITKFDGATASDEDAAAIRKAALDLNIGGLLPSEGPLAKMGDDEEDDDDMEKEKMKDKMKDLKKSLSDAHSIISLTSVEKSHYDGLNDDGKSAFLKMDASDRETAISKANDADPVIYKSLDGMEFRKSDDDRMVQMAKSNDRKSKDLAKAQAAARDSDIEKREAELDQLPGKSDVKKGLIGAILDIEDADIRKGAFAILKAANSANDDDFKRAGTLSKADVADADSKLEKMAKAHAAENSVPYAQAYMAVTKSGEGAKLYKALRTGTSE